MDENLKPVSNSKLMRAIWDLTTFLKSLLNIGREMFRNNCFLSDKIKKYILDSYSITHINSIFNQVWTVLVVMGG